VSHLVSKEPWDELMRPVSLVAGLVILAGMHAAPLALRLGLVAAARDGRGNGHRVL
jgi:hypothetical protein